MTYLHFAVIALLILFAAAVIAIVWGKNFKAAFNFLGLGSFTLEATEPERKNTPRPRKPRTKLPVSKTRAVAAPDRIPVVPAAERLDSPAERP